MKIYSHIIGTSLSVCCLGVATVSAIQVASMICGAYVNGDATKSSTSCIATIARQTLRLKYNWDSSDYTEPNTNPIPIAVEGVVDKAEKVDNSLEEFSQGNTDLRLSGIPGEKILSRDEIVDALVAKNLAEQIRTVGGSKKLYPSQNSWLVVNTALGVEQPNVVFIDDKKQLTRAIYLVKGGGSIDVRSTKKGMEVKIKLGS